MDTTMVKRGSLTHGFGYIPDPQGHRYNGFFLHPAAKQVTYPDNASLFEHVPPRWDQGGTSSCTGHGFAGAITTTFSAHNLPLSSPAWPRGIYDLGRIVDRVRVNGVLPPLKDEGAFPNSVVRGIGEWGISLEEDEDGGKTATSPDYTSNLESHINDDPQLVELENASERLMKGFNSISSTDLNKVDQLCLAISTGHAPMGAVDAGSDAFQGFRGDGVLGFTGAVPDHWIFFAAYRTNAQGKKEFLLINSWGLGGWTPDGTAWCSEDFINRGLFNILIPNLGL